MIKKHIALVVMSLTLIALLAACTPGLVNQAETVRTISVTGTGVVTIVPDLARVNIGVRTEAENVGDALEENNRQAEAISASLQDLGVEEKDIQTSNFNVYPSDRYDPMTGQVQGRYFVVENTVNVTVRELASLSDVLGAVVDAGANSIYGISFDVEDRDSAIAEARKLAIADAKAKAEAIAEVADVNLGELISINIASGNQPYPYFNGMGGSMEQASVPISAGTLTISAEANLSYALN